MEVLKKKSKFEYKMSQSFLQNCDGHFGHRDGEGGEGGRVEHTKGA